MTTDAMHGVQQRLNDIIECSVCKDIFSDTRTLPCVHSFCLRCVKGFSGDKYPGDSVGCPICRTKFTIPDEGVDGLPKNFFIEQLKDIAVTRSSSACDGCRKAETDVNPPKRAFKLCIECQQQFCEDCVDVHRRVKATRRHKLVEVNDSENILAAVEKMTPMYCDEHSEETVKLYCFDCETAMCLLCFAELHSGHKCSDVNKVADDFRKQMTHDMEKIVEAEARCRDLLNEQERNKREFSSAADEIEKAICKRVDQLKESIDSEKRRLLEDLEIRKRHRLKQIQLVIEDLEQHMSFVKNLIRYSDELINKGSVSDITQQRSSLHTRAAELMKLDNIYQSVNDLGSLKVKFEAAKTPFIGQVQWQQDLVVQSTDPSSTSVLAHVISDRREVVAVTSTESLLFVLRNPSERQIEVYDVKTFRQQRALQVKDLSNRTLCYYDAESCGLTSCVTNNCIYVSDYSKDTLHKIELSGNNGVFSWHVDGSPGGLSLNTARNLLVACYRATKIQEYTTNGSLLREIDLKSTDGELRPLHVLQLTGDQFVVSCWNESNRIYDVAEIDSQGRVVLSYTNQLQSTTRRKFKDPRHLAFDKNNDLLLVADMRDNRIVMLNRSLNCCERELDVMSVGGLQSPSCLYFDVAQNRLIVGEGPFSQYRVLVIELSTISV